MGGLGGVSTEGINHAVFSLNKPAPLVVGAARYIGLKLDRLELEGRWEKQNCANRAAQAYRCGMRVFLYRRSCSCLYVMCIWLQSVQRQTPFYRLQE